MHRTSGRPWHKETIRTSFSARETPLPIGSMYGIYTYIYHKNHPNVGIYTIHGSYGLNHDTIRYPDTAPNLYRITHCHLRFRHWGDAIASEAMPNFKHCFFLEFSSLIFFELVVFHQPIWKNMFFSGSSSPKGANSKNIWGCSPPSFVNNCFSTKVLGNGILSHRSDFQGENVFFPNLQKICCCWSVAGSFVGNLYSLFQKDLRVVVQTSWISWSHCSHINYINFSSFFAYHLALFFPSS